MACENAMPQNIEDPQNITDEIARGIKIIYSDSAIIRLTIEGETMVRKTLDKALVQEFPDGILISIFSPNGSMNATIESNKATWNEKKKEAHFEGNVKLLSAKNEKMTTEELFWNQSTEKITSNRLITIVTPTDSIQGIGLDAKQDLSSWKIIAPFGPMRVNNRN